MSWHLYSLTFKLRSPLHIGFHKVMHLFRTRAYVPARPFWGALTAKLTKTLKSSNCKEVDYKEVGEFLRRTMRFGYLYLSVKNDRIFMPKYTDDGLKFGNLPQTEFEKRFISSIASTAIEPNSLTAEEGMLHEVEFINPYEIDKENEKLNPVFLRGLIWIFESFNGNKSVSINENDFSIKYNRATVKFSELASTLQVGGERKYGFGLIMLEKIEKINNRNLESIGFNSKWYEHDNKIVIELNKDDFIWGHLKYNGKLKIKGNIEPIVGRDWDNRGAGKKLTNYGLCWSPGSVILEPYKFVISEDFGLWEIP